jgi:hypothetical protein
MAFRKLFFKRVQGIRDNYLLQEGDIALDEDDFKLYRGDGSTTGGVVIGGAGGGIALTDISVTQASASGAGTLAYNSSTGVITYTPPTASGLGALTSVPAQTFASLTSKPTTIAGYGIADALELGTTSTTALAGNTSIPSVLTDLGISDGTNSQVLTTNGSGTFTFQDASGGSGLQSRSTSTGTTGSLADAAQADLDITGFKSYLLATITTNRAARVRLYTTAAARTADASRAEGTDPAADAGVIAEVITTGSETVTISPGALGFNLEGPPTTTIPCRVTNKSGGTNTVQVSLHVVQLES